MKSRLFSARHLLGEMLLGWKEDAKESQVMLRPDVEALLQGAIDNTLTLEERDTLRRLMAESVEVRGRAAHLEQLIELLESLPPADAPPRLVHDVLAQISNSTRQEPVLKFTPVPRQSPREVSP